MQVQLVNDKICGNKGLVIGIKSVESILLLPPAVGETNNNKQTQPKTLEKSAAAMKIELADDLLDEYASCLAILMAKMLALGLAKGLSRLAKDVSVRSRHSQCAEPSQGSPRTCLTGARPIRATRSARRPAKFWKLVNLVPNERSGLIGR